MAARVEVEDHRGAVVDSVKDGPALDAIVRAAARAGHAFSRADAVEVLFALYAMAPEGRQRLAARLRAAASHTPPAGGEPDA